MKELPHTHSCFVCGESNPLGFNLRSQTDGRVVQAHFTFRAGHVGFKDTVHGGLIATLLDEIMVWACAVRTRRFAYCAELNVRYLKPVLPGIRLAATAELVADRRGRIFEAKADLLDEASIVRATATGKYLPLKNTDSAKLSADFLGDLGWIIGT